MRIAICDDDNFCIENMEQYLNGIDAVDFEYDIFYNGETLLKTYYEKGHIYDAIFLDMEMGQDRLNGINIANMIRNLDKQVIIVFITNHTKYVLDSFVCSPFRFLVKPVDFKTFKNVFFKILEKLDEDKATLFSAPQTCPFLSLKFPVQTITKSTIAPIPKQPPVRSQRIPVPVFPAIKRWTPNPLKKNVIKIAFVLLIAKYSLFF